MTEFALFNLGGWEIVLILAIVLLLFGAKKLPQLAKGLGQSIAEFKKAGREIDEPTPQQPTSSTSPKQDDSKVS